MRKTGTKIRTPWGISHSKEFITPWLFVVNTAGHGGVKLDRKHNAIIPKEYRVAGGWYEEDYEVAIPLYFLFELIQAERTGAEWLKINKDQVKESINRYFISIKKPIQ